MTAERGARALLIVAWGAAAALGSNLGCNSITGVNDLSFDGAAGSSSGAGGGGGAAGSGAGGSAGDSCDFRSLYPGCNECMAQNCCDQLAVCAADPSCNANCVGDNSACEGSPSGSVALLTCKTTKCPSCRAGDMCTRVAPSALACDICCSKPLLKLGLQDFNADLNDCACKAAGPCAQRCDCPLTNAASADCRSCLGNECSFERCKGSKSSCGAYLQCADDCLKLQ